MLSVLVVRMGRIERVSDHLGEWAHTLHKISCGGGVVRFEGYRSQHANTVDVLAAAPRVTLLVVAPEASAHTAHVALLTAGHRGNTDDVDTLLRSARSGPRSSGAPRASGKRHCSAGKSTAVGMIVADEKVRHNGRWADPNVDRPRKPPS